MWLEVGGEHFGPSAFPGQQGRPVFAFLVAERSRPVARSELTELLWPGGDPPPSRDAALSAVVSKLRTLLRRAGARSVELTAEPGSYELRLQRGSWVDLEAAADAVDLARFRETAYQLLMRAHATAGNAAEALRVYERCRSLLSDELGVDPSPQTKAVHREVLATLQPAGARRARNGEGPGHPLDARAPRRRVRRPDAPLRAQRTAYTAFGPVRSKV